MQYENTSSNSEDDDIKIALMNMDMNECANPYCSSQSAILKCTLCKEAMYCSKSCERFFAKEHRRICLSLKVNQDKSSSNESSDTSSSCSSESNESNCNQTDEFSEDENQINTSFCEDTQLTLDEDRHPNNELQQEMDTDIQHNTKCRQSFDVDAYQDLHHMNNNEDQDIFDVDVYQDLHHMNKDEKNKDEKPLDSYENNNATTTNNEHRDSYKKNDENLDLHNINQENNRFSEMGSQSFNVDDYRFSYLDRASFSYNKKQEMYLDESEESEFTPTTPESSESTFSLSTPKTDAFKTKVLTPIVSTCASLSTPNSPSTNRSIAESTSSSTIISNMASAVLPSTSSSSSSSTLSSSSCVPPKDASSRDSDSLLQEYYTSKNGSYYQPSTSMDEYINTYADGGLSESQLLSIGEYVPLQVKTTGNCRKSILDNSKDSILDSSRDSNMDDSKDSNMDNSKDSILDNSRKSILDNSRKSILDNSRKSILDNSKDSYMDNSRDSNMDNSRDSNMDNSKDSILDSSRDSILVCRESILDPTNFLLDTKDSILNPRKSAERYLQCKSSGEWSDLTDLSKVDGYSGAKVGKIIMRESVDENSFSNTYPRTHYEKSGSSVSSSMSHDGPYLGSRRDRQKSLKYGVQWVDKRKTRCCQICNTEFGVIRLIKSAQKHHCRMCGRVICSKCSKSKYLLQKNISRKKRVCVDCHRV